jgi:hypothetical protein
MKIVIPNVASPGDTTGLECKKIAYGTGRLWYARYSENGVYRRKSLKTHFETIARNRRDALYAELVAKGATVAGPAGRKARVQP